MSLLNRSASGCAIPRGLATRRSRRTLRTLCEPAARARAVDSCPRIARRSPCVQRAGVGIRPGFCAWRQTRSPARRPWTRTIGNRPGASVPVNGVWLSHQACRCPKQIPHRCGVAKALPISGEFPSSSNPNADVQTRMSDCRTNASNLSEPTDHLIHGRSRDSGMASASRMMAQYSTSTRLFAGIHL